MSPLEIIRRLNKEFYASERAEGARQGHRRRTFLLDNGLDVENMANNTYSGRTFCGLYSYMNAMRSEL